MLFAVEAGAVKEGSGFLPSRRFLGHAITACAVKACAVKVGLGSCHQGGCRRGGFWVVLSRWVQVLEAGQGASTSLRVQILFIAVVAGRAVTGARSSVGVSRAGQIWIRSVPHGQAAVASFGGSSKLWRRQQALEVVVSFEGSSKL